MSAQYMELTLLSPLTYLIKIPYRFHSVWNPIGTLLERGTFSSFRVPFQFQKSLEPLCRYIHCVYVHYPLQVPVCEPYSRDVSTTFRWSMPIPRQNWRNDLTKSLHHICEAENNCLTIHLRMVLTYALDVLI
jgi:hypothetical protein